MLLFNIHRERRALLTLVVIGLRRSSRKPLHARSDGLERLQVADAATVADLKRAINAVLNIPTRDMAVSKNAGLVLHHHLRHARHCTSGSSCFTAGSGRGAPTKRSRRCTIFTADCNLCGARS